MEFKLNKISAAVTGALAVGFAGHAAALSPTVYTTANTTDVYLSGASAQDTGIKSLMRRICVGGTLDQYSGGANDNLYFCQVNTTQVSGLSKPNIAVRKSSSGGSGNGVQPVAGNTSSPSGVALSFLDLGLIAATFSTSSPATAAQGGCGVGTVQSAVGTTALDTIGLPSYTLRTCSLSFTTTNTSGSTVTVSYTSNQIPDAGFSDVEPALFGASAAQLANLKANSVNNVIFSIIGTKGLRDALQSAQLLTVGAEDEANMPTLTTTAISAILSGNVTSWANLAVGTGAPFHNSSTIYATSVSQAEKDSAWIVRRVSTSGTQTFAQVHFLNQGCTPGVVTMPAGNDTAANTAGLTCGANAGLPFYEGSGGGDVKNCMISHDSKGHWAIGILTSEDLAPTATSSTWRHLKIDGFAPTQLNVFNGKYKYWSEQSMQYRSTTNALAGDKKTFVDTLAVRLADPFVIDNLNSASVQTWGVGGLMALAISGSVPPDPTTTNVTAAVLAANPVNTHTRNPGGVLNNCQPAIPIWPISGK